MKKNGKKHILLNLAVELILSKRQRSEFHGRPGGVPAPLSVSPRLLSETRWSTAVINSARVSFSRLSVSQCTSAVASGSVSQYVCGRRERRGQSCRFNWLSFTQWRG